MSRTARDTSHRCSFAGSVRRYRVTVCSQVGRCSQTSHVQTAGSAVAELQTEECSEVQVGRGAGA